MPDLTGNKILIIIAYEGFQNLEFKPVYDYLSMFGANVKVGSTSIGTAQGSEGGSAEVDMLLTDIHPEDYNAIIYIGGPGAKSLTEDNDALKIAKLAATHCDVLAAICIAPTILARAGALFGRRATVWTSSENNSAANVLTNAQAKYSDKDVVVDGNIVTANGPESAQKFVETLAEMLP
jgi:protease I